MAIEKPMNSRVLLKNDIEANWMKAVNFIPKLGELIIYNAEVDNVTTLPQDPETKQTLRDYWINYPRIKIGDGTTNVNDLPFITDAMEGLELAIDGKADAEHTHTIESIDGLQEAVNAAADSKFYVVTFDIGSDGEYHGDLTFAEIREKFEAGGNMVARIDGTDYIPLLSAASHQIIFSGIYQSQSVALTITANDVCTLTTTSLSRSGHNHTAYETKEDSQLKYTELSSGKKNKDLIVTFADDTKTTSTHTSEEIYAVVNEGTTVYFNNGGTNFRYLEGASSVATFYTNYFDNDVMQADAYIIRGNKITHQHFQNDIITQSDVDTSVNNLKNELLNGAGEGYDTLKELGDLINENHNAIHILVGDTSVQSQRIDAIEAEMIEGLEAVTSKEISALFL